MKIKTTLFGAFVLILSQSAYFSGTAHAQNTPQNCAAYSFQVADREIGFENRYTQEWIDRQSEVYDYCRYGYGGPPGYGWETPPCGMPMPGFNPECASLPSINKGDRFSTDPLFRTIFV